ncbi:MAG: YccF domain-containing protein [Actinobacteria bacterium]|nr:YccF domain-containing protein [Actinomycetota bacterium]
MRVILNIIWLVFAGFWLALGYAALGVIAFLLIITIPFGVASFRMANYALWPFGRTVVAKPGAGAGSVIANVIWLLIAGIPIVVGHVTTAAAQAVTIIGIPLAIANIKMIPISLFPFGKEIVPVGFVPPGYTAVHAVLSEGDRLGGPAGSHHRVDPNYIPPRS